MDKSFYQRILDGEFNNKVPYPENRPSKKSKKYGKWLEDLKNHRKGEGEAVESFKLALFEDFGIEDNPKRELLFEKAWSQGHAYGYNEVYIHFQDLVDLIL